MTGTLINVATVIFGSLIGLLLRSRLPDRIIRIIFQVLGLFTIILGVSMALKGENLLLVLFSIVSGGILGELMRIEYHMEQLSERVRKRLKGQHDKFTEGFITAFLLFCVGPMATLGPIEEGLGQEPNLLLTKATLDGFSSISLSAGFGLGVMMSAIPMALLQGGLTLFAEFLQPILHEELINEISSVGGIMLLGIGINILEIKRLPIINLLPALLTVVALFYALEWVSL
ncbi:MAG: DUF554 domain-containing protein [Bacteroidota bacterium]